MSVAALLRFIQVFKIVRIRASVSPARQRSEPYGGSMRRPLWKRLLDLFALTLSALICMGFAAGAILASEGWGDSFWKLVISVAFGAGTARVAPLMIHDWRKDQTSRQTT